jgi:endonuclease/exonuclease/phosphatase family metal-dependent hydrolase
VRIYVGRDLKEKLQMLEGWIGRRKEGIRTIIGGDFNARTGRKRGGRMEERGEERGGVGWKERKLKDEKENKEGKR